MSKMTPNDAAEILRQHNAWRRDNDDEAPHPDDVGGDFGVEVGVTTHSPPAQAAQVDSEGEPLVQVSQRDASNYCQIISLLGMEEEGDPVAEVHRMLTTAEPVAQHPDDHHVEMFADDMKRKLAAARAKGRGGWDGDEPGMQQRISDMLRDHVEKGDPCDVANFCMFLHQRGESILPAEPVAQVSAVPDGWVLVPLVPTERMVVEGFEAASEFEDTDAYQTELSGCQRAAERARICYAAMLAAAPSPGESV